MSEVKPVLYLGTKLVPYEERTFRIADLRDAMGYTHDHKQFYSEEQVQKLLAENERLRGEVDTAQRGRAHTEQWYAERLEPIKEVAKREGLWPEIAAIIANGSGTRQLPDGSFFFDPPTYAQQLNAAKHKAEASEARAERLAEALRDARVRMLGQVKWVSCDCGCEREKPADAVSVAWLREVQQFEIALSKEEGE